jgi:hypothetical protein
MSDRTSGCNCPYCDAPLCGDLCRPCDLKVSRCPECGEPVPKDTDNCPECGAACAEPTDTQED